VIAQQGILTRPPEHLLAAGFAFAGDCAPQRSRETLGLLQELVHRQLRSNFDDLNATSLRTAFRTTR
jgi:hypothetical protein